MPAHTHTQARTLLINYKQREVNAIALRRGRVSACQLVGGEYVVCWWCCCSGGQRQHIGWSKWMLSDIIAFHCRQFAPLRQLNHQSKHSRWARWFSAVVRSRQSFGVQKLWRKTFFCVFVNMYLHMCLITYVYICMCLCTFIFKVLKVLIQLGTWKGFGKIKLIWG